MTTTGACMVGSWTETDCGAARLMDLFAVEGGLCWQEMMMHKSCCLSFANLLFCCFAYVCCLPRHATGSQLIGCNAGQ